MIQLDNVTKEFKRGDGLVRALENVTIDIPKGTLATVRGPSGSGKSTLINVAAGLMRPSSGSITVAGQKLDALGNRERTALRAERVAVVFQLFHLVPYLTALENVLVPALAARKDGDAAARARELIEELGLAERMAHYPDELSAGERQRFALARALLNGPEVVLADEPTGNLDPESADHVLRMLWKCREDGATVLLVTHHPVAGVTPDIELHLRAGKLEA